MTSSIRESFRKRFEALPAEAQELAVKSYRLWKRDPRHASLHFKKVGQYWSVRVGRDYRALAQWQGDKVVWTWIGLHDEYEQIINR